jgi:hypothetical protein
MKILIAAALLAWGTLAVAHGNAVSLSADSVRMASEDFEKDGSLVQKFAGVKAWPEGDKIRVRFYLSDNATVEYGCHEMGGQFMCMKAQ